MPSSYNPVRIAVLDDYQRVALKYADWSVLQGRATIDVFSDTLLDEQAIVERLKDYDIICSMRERTRFPATLLGQLPKLRWVHFIDRN
jgi:phosphoglycerate dehydrogenase-like enzyme